MSIEKAYGQPHQMLIYILPHGIHHIPCQVYHNGSNGVAQDQLAQKLHVNKSNVARQLFMLEENDFIERRRCENDRRVMEVFPTEKAIAVEKKIREANSEWRRALFADMTEEERELLEEVLDRLARRAEALG